MTRMAVSQQPPRAMPAGIRARPWLDLLVVGLDDLVAAAAGMETSAQLLIVGDAAESTSTCRSVG